MSGTPCLVPHKKHPLLPDQCNQYKILLCQAPPLYKVIGVKSLRKAVTVALCIVSITFALIAGMCISLDINVVSWWICFSVGLNLMYYSRCNNNCY